MHFYVGRTRFTSKFSTLLTVTDPPICCLGMLVTHLGVLKPCYTVERQLEFSENSTDSTLSQATPIHASKVETKVGNSFLHQKMKGTVKKLSNNSTKHSISKEQLQGSPLTKQDILDVYVDILTRIGKFPGQVPT